MIKVLNRLFATRLTNCRYMTDDAPKSTCKNTQTLSRPHKNMQMTCLGVTVSLCINSSVGFCNTEFTSLTELKNKHRDIHSQILETSAVKYGILKQ